MSSFEETFDLRVAQYFIHKKSNADKRGIEFSLSLISFYNILKAKRCYYTGIELTFPECHPDGKIVTNNGKAKNTDITIERLDPTQGYVKGNCVACSRYANGLKSVFENPNNGFKKEHFIRMAKILDRQV